MKSRLAITMILALGILMSLSGAGLAVSGLGDSGSGASDIQYSNDPGTEESSDSSETSEESSSSEVLGDSGGSDGSGDVQEAAQESGGDDKLAFTGFAAIPVLVGGLALLGSGMVLRRRSARDDG